MRFNQKIFGVIFFAALFFYSQMAFAQQAPDLKSEIFPKLRDRKCDTMSLDKCNCPDAKEIKGYIEGLIEAGVKKEDVIYKAAKKFSPSIILDSQLKAEIEKKLATEIGENRPQISLETETFDFGKVSKKQGPARKIIKLRNKGNQDLIVSEIKPSCSCTTVSLQVDKNKSSYFGQAGSGEGWQMVIGPNKEGELEIVFDAAHPTIKAGHVSRNIAITSNDPLYGQVVVRFEVQVTD